MRTGSLDFDISLSSSAAGGTDGKSLLRAGGGSLSRERLGGGWRCGPLACEAATTTSMFCWANNTIRSSICSDVTISGVSASFTSSYVRKPRVAPTSSRR
jgi:hypothetical protein